MSTDTSCNQPEGQWLLNHNIFFNLRYMYTNTVWNTQGFNHTADQKLSTPDAGWGRISLLVFTLWFHSGIGWQHMGPWHASERSQSIITAEAKRATQELSSRQLWLVQSNSHNLTCCPQACEMTHRGGENDWQLCWLKVTPEVMLLLRVSSSQDVWHLAFTGHMKIFTKTHVMSPTNIIIMRAMLIPMWGSGKFQHCQIDR